MVTESSLSTMMHDIVSFENTKKFAKLDETKDTLALTTLPRAGPGAVNPS